MKKNYIPIFLIGFFLVIFTLRLVDSFCIRTDQGPIGELFTHKLAGFALLVAAVRFLRLKWDCDIGFKRDQLLRGILTGLAIGGSAFLVAYVLANGVETAPTLRIAIAQTIMFIVVAVRYFGWKKTVGYTSEIMRKQAQVPLSFMNNIQ